MKISLLYLLNKDDYIDSLNSVLKFVNNQVELIIFKQITDDINTSSFEKTDNVKVVNSTNESLCTILKRAKDFVNGEYIFLITPSMVINKKTFKKLLKAIESREDIYFLENNYYRLNSTKVFRDEMLLKIPFSILLNSYVFRKEYLRYADQIIDICDSETNVQMLLNIYREDAKIHFISDSELLYLDKLSINHDCYNKKWYKYTIDNIYNKFVTDNDVNFKQFGLMYCSIFNKFFINKDGANKEVLLGKEREDFFNSISKLLKKFNDDFFKKIDVFDSILKNDYGFKYFMFYLRDEIKDYKVYLADNNILRSKINEYDTVLGPNLLNIVAINYGKRKLVIDAKFEYINLYDFDNDCICALVNGKKVKPVKTEIYSLKKYFAIALAKSYTFQLVIPITDVETKIEFKLALNGKEVNMPLTFTTPAARLTDLFKNSYWHYKDIEMKYKNESLIINKASKIGHLKNELLFFHDMLWHSSKHYNIKNLFLRIAYWIFKPFYSKKRIWLYFDKLYMADDNGEFAIEYTTKIKDNIEHYYVINKDSYDYERILKKNIKILNFNSLKHKLFVLYAENIVATHPDIIKFCGFGKNLSLAFRNLYNANIICIAHGLTMQKNAEVQNRLYDNTMFYTTSSKYEVNHLLKPVYGYSKNQIALTGMARFDKMISHPKKQILITPTWRRSVSGSSNFNSPKNYNEEFKSSSYYKVYNSLINDVELIEAAKKNGYKLIFLLHPAMSAQKDDYDKNDYVEFIQATSEITYNKILSEANLMVTDYSGVQYDFAYMHKPIVYYHSKELPPRFEEGALIYETMGFGPICTNHEEIIKELVKYINNDCKLEREYEKRINNFFAFDDQLNSKRIYEAILKFTEDNKD